VRLEEKKKIDYGGREIYTRKGCSGKVTKLKPGSKTKGLKKSRNMGKGAEGKGKEKHFCEKNLEGAGQKRSECRPTGLEWEGWGMIG